jgi:hypothetical protein
VTAQNFEDLFDIEKRPGAGLELWTSVLEWQLERVREANHRHRLNNSPDEEEHVEDAEAEERLHGEVYFLTLTIRRVLLFHALLAKQVADPRLEAARADFELVAPQAKTFRDMYEHVDEYLLDSSRKRVKFPGRASPILMSRWDCDNVVIAFGDEKLDVTLAAVAAIKLGKTSAAIWEEYMDRAKAATPKQEVPPPDDGVPRTFGVTMGVSAIVGGEDEGHRQFVGTLLGTNVRDATPEEVAHYARKASSPRTTHPAMSPRRQTPSRARTTRPDSVRSLRTGARPGSDSREREIGQLRKGVGRRPPSTVDRRDGISRLLRVSRHRLTPPVQEGL